MELTKKEQLLLCSVLFAYNENWYTDKQNTEIFQLRTKLLDALSNDPITLVPSTK